MSVNVSFVSVYIAPNGVLEKHLIQIKTKDNSEISLAVNELILHSKISFLVVWTVCAHISL